MAATYPNAVRAFVPRVDRVDLNAALDINDLQEEVVAVESVLGRNPQVSAQFPSAESVADRLARSEEDTRLRLAALESRMRRAAVSVFRPSSIQVNSSLDWTTLVMPDTLSTLNDFDGTLYDGTTGRFFAVAVEPGIWTLSASVNWAAVDTGSVGVRGLAIRSSGGTLLAVDERTPQNGRSTFCSVSWTGRLPTDPAYYLELVVRQNQGTAQNILGNAGYTPCRADFTHVPG